MTNKAKDILQSYNLAFIETHQHHKAIASVVRTLAQNISSSSDKNPTEEWSKGFVVGVASVKQELFRIAEGLENYNVVTEEE